MLYWLQIKGFPYIAQALNSFFFRLETLLLASFEKAIFLSGKFTIFAFALLNP